MRKLTVLALFLLFLVGCAQVKQAQVDLNACFSDPVCREEAVSKANDISGKAAAISSVSPIPATPLIVKPIAQGISLLIFLIIGGAALRKKENG